MGIPKILILELNTARRKDLQARTSKRHPGNPKNELNTVDTKDFQARTSKTVSGESQKTLFSNNFTLLVIKCQFFILYPIINVKNDF